MVGTKCTDGCAASKTQTAEKELVAFYPTNEQRKEKEKHRLQAQFLPSVERTQVRISHLPATQTSNFPGVGPLPPPPPEQIYFAGSISKLIASKDKKRRCLCSASVRQSPGRRNTR